MATKKVLPVERDELTSIRQRATITNTVALSSDMDTLYIIENGRPFEYSLLHPNGIFVGTMRGQIVAGTAEGQPTADEVERKITLSAKRSFWTATYRRSDQTFNVIGATDIDVGIVESVELKTQIHRLPIGKALLHIRRSGDNITICVMKG